MRTLVFAAIVLSVVAYGYFGVYEQDKKEAEEEQEQARLINVEEKDVSSFSLANGKDIKEFSYKDGQWFIHTPVEEVADQQRVTSLVKSLIVMKSQSIAFDTGEEFSKEDYGLTGGFKKFAIGTSDGKVYEFHIGTQKTYDGNSYIFDLSNKRLMIFNNQIDSYYKKPLFEFRDKRLVVVNPIQEIKIDFEGDTLLNLSQNEEQWQLKGNAERKLNSKEVDKLLRSLNDLRLIDLIDEDFNKKQFGLRKPKLEIELNGEYRIGFGANADENKYTYVKATGKSAVGKVYSNVIESFLKPEADYYDLNYLFKLKRSEIDQIDINESNQFTIVKEESDWKLKEPAGKSGLNTARVDSLLNQIVNLRPIRLLKDNPKTFPKDPQIKIKDKKGQILFELVWGKKFKKNLSPQQGKEDYYPVKTNLGSDVVAIPGGDIEPLLQGLLVAKNSSGQKGESTNKPEDKSKETKDVK